MLSNADVITRHNIFLIGRTTIQPQFQIVRAFRFWIEIVTSLCIETEHISKYL